MNRVFLRGGESPAPHRPFEGWREMSEKAKVGLRNERNRNEQKQSTADRDRKEVTGSAGRVS